MSTQMGTSGNLPFYFYFYFFLFFNLFLFKVNEKTMIIHSLYTNWLIVYSMFKNKSALKQQYKEMNDAGNFEGNKYFTHILFQCFCYIECGVFAK